MHTNTAVVLQTALPTLRRQNCFIPGLLDTTHCIQPKTPDRKTGSDIKMEFGIILPPNPHKNGIAFIKKDVQLYQLNIFY